LAFDATRVGGSGHGAGESDRMSTPSPELLPRAEARSAAGHIVLALRELVRTRKLRNLLLCNCVLGMAQSFVMPFLSLFATHAVKMSLEMFGLFMTANTVLGVTLNTWLSQRSDTTLSRRSLLLTGSFAGAAGYLGYAFVREPWQLFLIGGGVLGFASLPFTQLFAHARELVERSGLPKRDVPLYMNVFRMAFALAWTVGPALASFLLRTSSFVGLFLGAAALYSALFVLVLRTVDGAVPALTTRPEERLRDVLARRDVLFWFISLTLVLAAHTMSINNMSLLVLKELGGDESQVGIIFSLAPLFELPSMLYVGLLATRVQNEKLIRSAMLLASVYYLGVGLVRAPYQIYPLQALSAAFVSVTSGVAITFFQNKLPERLGAATNLYANAQRVGSTSSYLTFGLVASRFGHRGTSLTCALLAFVAFALTLLADGRPGAGARPSAATQR
jgi:SET family sugar efflux transporter-like MFS transporter